MSRRFEVKPVAAGWKLLIDGKRVVDENAVPRIYPTAATAWFVAENWDRLRAPSFAEMRAMTDDEIRRRAVTGPLLDQPPT